MVTFAQDTPHTGTLWISMIENCTNEPLKVRNWNSDKPEKRVDYTLQIMEGGHWEELGFVIEPDGKVTTELRYVGSLP